MRLTWPVADRGERFFSVSASASIDRILFEIAEEDELMEQVGITARRWYAEDLRLQARVRRNMAIVEAFAAVARERFLGPGPWRVLPDRWSGDGSFLTPDDDPRWIYHDVLVAIDHARGLNNGLPSLWARNFDHLDLERGQRVMQVGAGTGYYAAVLAEIVGENGRVIAVECDGELVARARVNLGPWRQVDVVHGDGRTHDPGKVDVIIVFAGSTHPAPLWLDRLAPGGRLLIPLTVENQFGFLLRATRPPQSLPSRTEEAREATADGSPTWPTFAPLRAGEVTEGDAESIVLPKAPDCNRFDATSIGSVGIFPCIGGRDEEAAKRLQAAFDELRRGSGFAEIPIEALHRGDPGPEVTDKVWYHGPGFWLERKEAT
jgi:protein-L-isoaspartate(D-aspartate) O-methyltransferase